MRLMKIKKVLLILLLILFLCPLFLMAKDTRAIYSESLSVSPAISLTIVNSEYDVIYYLNDGSGNTHLSTTKLDGETLGSITPPTRTGYNFAGWYTDPDPANGTKVSSNYIVTADTYLYANWAKIVCKKAAVGTLYNGGACGLDGSCLSARDENDEYYYDYGDVIIYSTIAGAGLPVAGNAYDCDVDNDGDYTGGGKYTERFYFVRERIDSSNDVDNAVLVHYTNFDENGHEVLANGDPDTSSSRRKYSNAAGKAYLPYTTGASNVPNNIPIWGNPALASFGDNGEHAARYINAADIYSTCGSDIYVGMMDNCQFFFQNTRFSGSGKQSSNYINAEFDGDKYYFIDVVNKYINRASNAADVNDGLVRPVIEVPFNTIDGYIEGEIYTISFDLHCGNNCGEGQQVPSIIRHSGEQYGSLTEPYWGYSDFLGWYTTYENGTYSGLVTSSSIVTGNVTLHAKWGSSPAFEVENIGTYDSFNDVLSHVPNNTQTKVTLLKNFTTIGELHISSNKNIIFDLGGYTIINAKARHLIDNSGTLEIRNGKLKNITASSAARYVIKNESGAILRITGGTYISKNSSVIFNEGTFTMTNGTLTTQSPNGTVENAAGGVMTISGGSIINDGQRQAIYNNGGNLTVSDNAYLAHLSTQRGVLHNLNNGTVLVTGGTIECGKNGWNIQNDSGTITIGTADSTINTTTPVLRTRGLPIYANGGNVYFNDGIGYSRDASRTTINNSDKNQYFHILQDTHMVDHSGATRPQIQLAASHYYDSHKYYAFYLIFDDFTVTFDPDGGTLEEPYNTDPHMTVTKYDPITSLPPDPVKVGYVFGGWYLDTDTNYQNRVNVGYTITGTTTLVARWLNAYSVSFDSNGGSSVATMYVAQNTSPGTLPANPTRLHYIFDGWYLDDDTFTQPFTTSTVVQSDIEVHAKWRPSIVHATTTPSASTTFTVNEGASSQITIDVTGLTGVEDYTCVSNDTSIATVTKDNNTGNCIVSGVYYGITTIDIVGVESNERISIGVKVNDGNAPVGKKARAVLGLGNQADEYFDTLQDAVSSIPTDNQKYTVILFDDVTEHIVVAASQNIEFDFSNYTVTADSGYNTLKNFGTVTMNNGRLTSNNAAANNMQTVVNEGSGVFNLNGGTIDSKYYNAVRNNGGTFNMTGGTISVPDTSGQGAVNNNTNGNYRGIMNISGGTISAYKRQAIYNEGANTILTISGNAILESAVYEDSKQRATLQNVLGTVRIYGGTIISTSDNAKRSPAVLNNSTMIIGDTTNGVDITTPIIRGIRYGLVNSGGTVALNGGIIMAKYNNSPINGTVTPLSGYELLSTNGRSDIDGVRYNTKYIVPTP